MTQRALRYPPYNARLVSLENGPPMFRMLGYADLNNRCDDLCFPYPYSFTGPFSEVRMAVNQTVPVGPGRFGLPMGQLPFTTYYWDDTAFPGHHYVHGRTLNRMYTSPLPTRPEAACFPERAIPGSGVNSRCVDSAACLGHHGRLPPDHMMC